MRSLGAFALQVHDVELQGDLMAILSRTHLMTSALIGQMVLIFGSCFNVAQAQTQVVEGFPVQRLKAAGFNEQAMQNFANYAFDPQAKYKTDALVVIKDGRLVFEQYSNGYTRGQRHMLWSFSKGIVNAILGVAEQKGIVNRETLVHQYYPELDRPLGRDIKLQHLLNMSSGLDYYEEHPTNIILSDSIFVNYSFFGYNDMAQYTASKPSKAAPGMQFNYSSGECNLAMGVLKKAMNNQLRYDSFPWVNLFNRIGMNSTTLEQDRSGTFVGGSYGWSTALDIAKLAQLYLNKGVWNGERLMSENWIDWSLQTAPALQNPQLVQSEQMRLNQEDYGAYWWLNKKLPMNQERPFPYAPENIYLAMGYRGQTLAVFPDQKMILVRLGSDGLGETKINRSHLVRLLLEGLKKSPNLNIAKPEGYHEHEAFAFSTAMDGINFLDSFWSLNTALDDGIVMAPGKDTCSCVFVTQRDAKVCMQEHEQYQQFRSMGWFDGWIRPLEIDYAAKKVTARNRSHIAEFTFVNKDLGCKMTRFVRRLTGEEMIPQ